MTSVVNFKERKKASVEGKWSHEMENFPSPLTLYDPMEYFLVKKENTKNLVSPFLNAMPYWCATCVIY